MSIIIPYVISILIAVALAIWPVHFAAKKLGAGKSTLLFAVIAVVFSVIIVNAVKYIFPNMFVAIPIAIGVVGFVYESVLETTIKNAILIAIIAVVINIAAAHTSLLLLS